MGPCSLCWTILPILLTATSQGALVDDWQTVFPDTRRVWKLFGVDGPQWRLSSRDCNQSESNHESTSIPAKVPGDVLTDLMRSGLIDDPYFDRNFFTQRSVWMGPPPFRPHVHSKKYDNPLEQRSRIWMYECEFKIPFSSHEFILVVEGIKMGASLMLNGVRLGNVTDQFLRYEFPLQNALTASAMTEQGSNAAFQQEKRTLYQQNHTWFSAKLTITFDPTIDAYGRFQACAGGWDWAPYTRTGDQQGSRTFTFGIWKSLYIVEQRQLSITQVVPKIFYLGDEAHDSPRSPLRHGPTYDFQVDVDVHFIKSRTAAIGPLGLILMRGNFTNQTASAKVPNDGTNVITLSLRAFKENIQLWWPSSHPKDKLQPLYTLQVAYQSIIPSLQTDWINQTIGFRTVDLVTFNDSNPLIVESSWHEEGSGNHGMFFRVNGRLISARGANVVPMDQLEGRLSSQGHHKMVESAYEAGMNMLRVWGGGMVLPQSFYQACDQFGILVYHDMMFVEENHHGARVIPTLIPEVRHLVRSLSAHPSIVLWSGCNECVVEMHKSTEIYATLVMQTAAEEDPTRPLWPSCPSWTGWKTGVSRVSGKPNGGPLTTYSQQESKLFHRIEVHGPYRHGISRTHPSMNANDDKGANDTNIPPDLNLNESVGPEFKNHFVSEFGVSTWSSFESISVTLSKDQWSLHGSGPPDECVHIKNTNYNECQGNNVLAERNYACDSLIEIYFGLTNFEAIGEEPFKAQLHKCIMASTIWLKGQIEILRGSNSFGTLIWQLNENWPTGGWGLLEYGSSVGQAGQSIGGRWKPAMHLLKQSLFREVFATCGQRRECYVRNDMENSLDLLNVVLEIFDLGSGDSINKVVVELPLIPGNGHIERFQCPEVISPAKEVLLISIRDTRGEHLILDHIVLWTEPVNLIVDDNHVVIEVIVVELHENGNLHVSLASNKLALYVLLTSSFEGHFEENAFALRKNETKKVCFEPSEKKSIDPVEFRKSLRVEHLLSYI